MLKLGIVPPVIVVIGGGAAGALVLGCALALAAFIAFLVDAIVADGRPRLRFERRAPGQLYIDQPERITWFVENRSSFPVTLQLADTLPSGATGAPAVIDLTAAARAQTSAGYDLTPSQRGPGSFGDLNIRVRGPLGLAWRQKRIAAKAAVRCLPHLANWKTAELAERRALVRRSGGHRYRWRGCGTLFESLREYTTQDDIRWVDWKATARQGRPISRNFEEDRHQQLVLLLDASRSMTTYCGHRTKFDAVLEAAVLVSRAALDQGDAIGMLLFADQVDVYLHPRRERTQMAAIMEHLYDKVPRLVEPDFEAALIRAAHHNVRRSLVILFTDVTVPESARRMLPYLRAMIPRHVPLVVTIADEMVQRWEMREPRTVEEFYCVGVAHQLMLERSALLEQLRLSGAEVLDSPADQIAARTIERYLELKRRLRI
jgi:uncharacterized protein (DUF58 family)